MKKTANANLFAALRAAFPADLDAIAVETDNGLAYSWRDLDRASAPGYSVAAAYAGYLKKWERWEFNAFARVDNLFDRRYAGSVIVNEGNARYFEPAPGRNWTVGMSGSYRF